MIREIRSDMHIKTKSVLLLLGAAILWSTAGLFIKWVEWNPFAIAGARSAIVSAVIWIYIGRPRFDWSAAQIGGAISFAATVMLFVYANKTTTAANAILLQYTAPVYVAVLGNRLLGEKPTLLSWVTLCLSIGGMVLFFFDRLSVQGFRGNLLAIVSGFTLALFFLFTRRQKDGSPLESILLGNIITAAVSMPFMFQSAPSLRSVLALLFLGIFQLGLADILYAVAIKNVPAFDAIIITSIEPILNPLWVFLFIGETPGRWAIAGGIIVIASVTMYSVIKNYKRVMTR